MIDYYRATSETDRLSYFPNPFFFLSSQERSLSFVYVRSKPLSHFKVPNYKIFALAPMMHHLNGNLVDLIVN